MNCDQCGAPLPWDGHRPIIVCEYCRSVQSLNDLADSIDRVVHLETPGDSTCPRCDQSLHQAALDGMRVEACGECSGVLIKGAVFAAVVRNRRADFRGSDKLVPFNPTQLQVKVDCPGCQRRMEVHPYYGPGNVVVDSCCHCGLVWLDAGEISMIETAPGAR